MAIYTMIDCTYKTVASLHETVAMIGRKVRRLATVNGWQEWGMTRFKNGKIAKLRKWKMARVTTEGIQIEMYSQTLKFRY